MPGTNTPENDFDAIWCDECDAFQPVKRENTIEASGLPLPCTADLVCRVCALVIVTVKRSTIYYKPKAEKIELEKPVEVRGEPLTAIQAMQQIERQRMERE